MPLYDYECSSCGAIFERIHKMRDRDNKETCPLCSGEASFKIAPPTIKLDPISGDFGTATLKWERMHKKQAELERKRDA